MVGVLNKIPVTQWIRGTIEKMNKAGKQDSQSWNDYWFETYKELGGQSEESGTKGCPKHAAYGLWRLGRIKETNIPYHHQAINSINQEYGKNAVYAILALDLLEKYQDSGNKTNLWNQVREQYKKAFHEEPAISQQGAISVALALFEEGQIVMYKK